MRTLTRLLAVLIIFAALFSSTAASRFSSVLQADNPNPPDQPVKLIFIHHSTGENWIMDGYGDLGQTLGGNNYFVSDTNYGWGPDVIGDRTDIPNWTEWFSSPNTDQYMEALFNEGGQNSSYTRDLPDPGGENEIIMFKSCFPNSALEGNPNDPAGTYEEMSVAGAKYVYNQILQYFATRPDKLFIVITAPPLSDSTYAENARAFNQWLLNDWLRENNYSDNNVAVFDFYNVLTDPNAHHRFNNGQIEHINGTSNTLYYPSGDDHPSEAGSRKATEEFVPLLNVFYHRWKVDAPLQPPPQHDSASGTGSQPEDVNGQSVTSAVIDDFESDAPAGTRGWEIFQDDTTNDTSLLCVTDNESKRAGLASRVLDFDIAANSWATCALFYETPQDWSAAEGVTFYMRAEDAALIFDVDLYGGPAESYETYVYTVETTPESVNGWIPIELHWADFHRADWEENAGAPFEQADQVNGMAFGFGTAPDAPNAGKIWLDDLGLLGEEGSQPADGAPPVEEPEEPGRPRLLPCGGSIALPVALVGLGLLNKRGRTKTRAARLLT